ncbi:MAG: LicD family protein [Lachnospiraceae bacterium]|nr:LicD family protein [Lachnospiraceae bacterium]
MIEITDEFLTEETRCGFVISKRMKQAWAAELKILSEIDALCKKYNITYFAEVGTLLGAVRHHGFIPWDDDIDLAMKREDYMKFLSVAHELPSEYRVKSMYNDVTGTYRQFHAVVENFVGDKLEWDNERNKKFFGCPFICAIDIFPLDYIPRDENARKMVKLLYNMAYVLAGDYDTRSSEQEYYKDLAVLEAHCGGRFSTDAPLRPQIYQLADRIAAMTSEADADDLDYFPKMVIGSENGIRKKEWYKDSFSLPFEMIDIQVPSGADEALTKHYGDYKSFVKGTAGHDYPFYKEQEELFTLQGFLK